MGNETIGGYSQSFWSKKLLLAILTGLGVWVVLRLVDFEGQDDRTFNTGLLYVVIFLSALATAYYAIRFVLDWEKEAPAPAAVKSVRATTKKAAAKDDLTEIEGVGPKIESILYAAGIMTYVDLAETSADDVQQLLQSAGKRFTMHDPNSWAQQAQLAADGEWAKLYELQEELDGGK